VYYIYLYVYIYTLKPKQSHDMFYVHKPHTKAHKAMNAIYTLKSE